MIRLNLNIICASINYVEIEDTCLVAITGRDHRG